MEVFPQKPGDPITRIDVDQPRGAFSVVVPAPESTDHVTVLQLAERAPRAPGERAAAAAEVIDLVSFSLTAKP
jgi:hypothetical protein